MPKIILNGVEYAGGGGGSGGDGSFVLLPATETRLGGIKESASIHVADDGTASLSDDAFATDEEVEEAINAIFN